jgi:hypothetical protein
MRPIKVVHPASCIGRAIVAALEYAFTLITDTSCSLLPIFYVAIERHNDNVTRPSGDGATSLVRMADRLLLSVGQPMKRYSWRVIMDLFVDGLPPSFTSNDLTNLFADFGTVLHADVVTNKDGNSFQFGFVAMGASREAYRAIASLHGSLVEGHPLLVMLAENQWSPRRSKYSPQDTPSPFA